MASDTKACFSSELEYLAIVMLPTSQTPRERERERGGRG